MALTGQAPFNRNALRAFRYSQQPPDNGIATPTEQSDTSSAVGGASFAPVVSALNVLAFGPQYRANKFRRDVRNSVVIALTSVTGTGTPTELGDTPNAAGGNTGLPGLSGLNVLLFGPQYRANKFRSSPRTTQYIPPSAINGSASITEPGDVPNANTGTLLQTSSLSPFNLGPGTAAPFNLNQFQAFEYNGYTILAITGTAAATETGDVASSVAGIGGFGAGTPTELGDVSAAVGSPVFFGSGTPIELSDVSAGVGSFVAYGEGDGTELNDVAAAVGNIIAPVYGSAIITESFDTPLAIGIFPEIGIAAATELPDVAVTGGVVVGQGTCNYDELPDLFSAVGAPVDESLGVVVCPVNATISPPVMGPSAMSVAAANIMNTSGTYGFAPSMGETVLYAYGLCGIRNTALTQQHFETARMACNMILGRWSSDGVNLWQVDLQVIPLIQGQATYSVPSNTIVMLDGYYTINNGATEIDRIMMPISRTEYASYSNKEVQGAPTVFWFDRLLAPTVTLYQTPNGQQASFKYYRLRQTQDANLANGQSLEIPYYFWDAFAFALAYRLALSWAPSQAPILKPLADEAWAIASKQNVESGSVYIAPTTGNYFR
jgi:hypothetical protein